MEDRRSTPAPSGDTPLVVPAGGAEAGGPTIVVPAGEHTRAETTLGDVLTPPPVLSPRPPAAAPLRPGTRLGRWVLERVIGEGATATVWAARHEQLGAPVAIKIFHRRDLPFRTVLGEARAAAGIPSRNAVWVYDVDTFDGHQAIVMELCADDAGVASSLRAGVRDVREAVRLVAEAARGVEAAHACDVFHKDIKPANVLVNPNDGRAQITDFGLANPVLWSRVAGGRREAQSTVCLDGSPAPSDAHDPCAPIRGSLRLGTPEFMAPEQAAGLRRDLDPRQPDQRRLMVAIDVYGLGATLWYLLAGRPPYPRDPRSGATDAAAIMEEVLAGPPEPLRRAAPDTPRRLARIVEKAMARDPFRRHASAGELAADLEAWLAQRPTSVDTSPFVRAWVHLRRERARVGLIALLAAVTLGSSWVVWHNARTIETQREELATLAALHAAARADVATAQERLAEAALAIDRKDGLLRSTSQELIGLEARLADAWRTIEGLRTEVAEATTELQATRTRLDDTTRARDALDAELSATRASLDAARGDLASARDELSATRADLAATTALADELAREVARLTAESEAKARRLLELQADLDAARADALRLSRELEAARREARILREENARLREMEEPPLPAPPTSPTPPP